MFGKPRTRKEERLMYDLPIILSLLRRCNRDNIINYKRLHNFCKSKSPVHNATLT